MNALRINVAGLLKEFAGAARDYPVSAPPDDLTGLLREEHDSVIRALEPLAGSVRLMRTQTSVFVRGQLASRLVLECSRCLDEALLDVQFQVEDEYFPEVDVHTGQGLPKPEDDLAFTIDPNHELDLTEAVRQHLLLEMPMYTVCREACNGLCARCGANLNAGACGCVPELEDGRFSVLKALLEGQSAAG
ncbi:MAG: YceD family protein [Chloroflexota bacterium]